MSALLTYLDLTDCADPDAFVEVRSRLRDGRMGREFCRARDRKRLADMLLLPNRSSLYPPVPLRGLASISDWCSDSTSASASRRRKASRIRPRPLLRSSACRSAARRKPPTSGRPLLRSSMPSTFPPL